MATKDTKFTEAEYAEVRDIYAMFRHLEQSYEVLADRSGIREEEIHFAGFDGNGDDAQRAAARRLASYDKTVELINSHRETLPHYRVMLQRWSAVKSDKNLTKDQIIRITSS